MTASAAGALNLARSGALATRARGPKVQPWRAFWPLDPAKYTEAEKARMPWLTFQYDKAKPTERPWRKWMLENQSTVVRRGMW